MDHLLFLVCRVYGIISGGGYELLVCWMLVRLTAMVLCMYDVVLVACRVDYGLTRVVIGS